MTDSGNIEELAATCGGTSPRSVERIVVLLSEQVQSARWTAIDLSAEMSVSKHRHAATATYIKEVLTSLDRFIAKLRDEHNDKVSDGV